ncbi:PAS domain-containing protein [Acidipila sp. EB88]|uniref:sensor histidine kinase n=1 Tax=Acidipila sp. EB88 TaxID=2305226 RepID=UPI0013151CDB|nr:PAS domain-containing protein [Acidipila sp. EB88]
MAKAKQWNRFIILEEAGLSNVEMRVNDEESPVTMTSTSSATRKTEDHAPALSSTAADLQSQNALLRAEIDDLATQLRMRHDEKAAASEEEVKRIVNSMPMLVWSAHPNGMVDFSSEKWLDYTGMTAETALGAGWLAAFHPDDVELSLRRWLGLMASGAVESAEVEVRVRRYDGQYRWFLVSAYAFKNGSGVIQRWFGSNIDIHDRKLAEDEVRRSEMCLSSAQRIGNVGSFSWSGGEDTLRCSEEFYRILGLEVGTSVTFGRILERVHPDGRFQVMSLRNQRFAKPHEHENRLIMKDGSEKCVLVKISRRESVGGAFAYHGAIADITEKRKSEDALAQARADLAAVAHAASMGEMAASIAHEVSQPLLGILTNAELALRKLSSENLRIDEASQAIRRVIRDANRASDVIRRLRDLYSRRGSAHEVVDLNDALHEVLDLSRSELKRERIAVSREPSLRAIQVKGDRIQLQQVMLNLLRNAIESLASTPEANRTILIRTYETAGQVTLLLEDSGKGFTPEDSRKLFDSFFSTKPGGMGIGLSISRSIIEAHRGVLWARNNDLGGATFGFDLRAATHTLTAGSGS